MNSLTALPKVIVGLFVYSFDIEKRRIWFAGLLFTPVSIIIGQSILGIPIITTMIISGFSKLDNRLYETLITLGSNNFNIFAVIMLDPKLLYLRYFRALVDHRRSRRLNDASGNIRLYTRTLTTAIALESSKGRFDLALAMGIVLLTIALLLNFLAYFFIKKEDLWKR